MADTEGIFSNFASSLQSALSNCVIRKFTALASVPRSVGRTAKTFGKERGKYTGALGLDRSRVGEGRSN